MPRYDLIVRNGWALLPDGEQATDIAVSDGTIAEIAPSITGSAAEEIDAARLHIFPGLIDAHVHFNEPGRTDWEGFATGSAALAAGGGTCFIEMPLNASPPTLDGKSFDLKRAAAEESSLTDFALWGGLTPNNLDHLEELAARGVVGFKAFMCDSGISDFAWSDDATLRRGMEIAARLALPVAVHAESQEITTRMQAEAQGRTWAHYVHSRPPQAEIEAIERAISLARETGCSLHIVHVSTSEGVDLVRAAAEFDRLDVTCETCPHYLLLNITHFGALQARAKCAPPLRMPRQNDLLWQHLARGTIKFVASDHSPAPPSMKTGDDAMAVWGGISGVQSTLSALLRRPELTNSKIADLTSGNVAERFRLPAKGRIAVGFDADFALVDLFQPHVLWAHELLDRHKLSPYVGRKFGGTIRRTIARGKTIYNEGSIQRGRKARLLTPSKERLHA